MRAKLELLVERRWVAFAYAVRRSDRQSVTKRTATVTVVESSWYKVGLGQSQLNVTQRTRRERLCGPCGVLSQASLHAVQRDDPAAS
jgi:hypothetical protein